MFKKIEDKIALQNRQRLGFVKLNQVHGTKLTKINVPKTEIPEDPQNEYAKWTKLFYFLNRAGNPFAVPVQDINFYQSKYTDGQYLRDFYDFNDIQHNPDKSYITTPLSNTQESGSVVLTNLLSIENAVYEYVLGGSGPTGQREYVDLNIGSNKISLSVWVDTYDHDNTGFTHNTEILYSSGINGLVDDWANIVVPIGTLGTFLRVYTYNHGDNPVVTLWNGKEGQNSKIGDGLGATTTDTFLNIQMNLGQKRNSSQKVPMMMTVPSWSSDPITSSSDPVTGNITNTLKLTRPSAGNDWEKIEVYRREIYSNVTIEKDLDNKLFQNNIVLSTSDKNAFQSGAYLKFGDTTERSMGSMTSYANSIDNSDFSYLTLNRPDDWTYTTTATGAIHYLTSTVYPYYGDYISNGQSIRIHNLLTDTTKSSWLESGYLTTDTSNFFSFYYKDEIGVSTGIAKALFYTSTDGTFSAERSSASVLFEDRASRLSLYDSAIGWRQFKVKFNVWPFLPPSDSTHIKMRLYSQHASTAETSYLLDGVHYGDMDAYYFFHTSAADKVVLQIAHSLDKAPNYKTVYSGIFDSTTKSQNNANFASEVGNQPFYITSTAWGTANAMGKAIGIFDSAHCWLKNGDFSGGLSGWTTVGAQAKATSSGGLFSNNYVRITNTHHNDAGLFYALQQPDYDAVNPLTSVYWMRSEYQEQKVRLFMWSLDNTRHDSALVTLTDKWAPYSYSVFYDTASNNTLMGVKPHSSTTFGFDIAGAIMSNSKWPQYVNTNDTSAGIVYQGTQHLKYDSALSSEFGTVRMTFTPLLDGSTGHPYNGLFFCGEADNYKSVYYDKSNSSFVFRQHDDTNDFNCVYSTPLSSLKQTHIVITWDSAKSVMYINNIPTLSTTNISTTNPASYHVGYNAPSLDTPNSANGFISNFRVDNCYWSWNDVRNDYNGIDFSYPIGTTVEAYSDTYIGEKKISGNDKDFEFIDDVSLEPSKKYHYLFKAVNQAGDVSILSSATSVVTGRKPYELYSGNKIVNSSFEYFGGQHNETFYWASAGPLKTQCTITATAYHGTRSVGLRGSGASNPTLQYQYLNITDTSISQCISWHTLQVGGFRVGDLEIKLYDRAWEQVGTVTASHTNPGELSSSRVTDNNGNTWIRFSTCLNPGAAAGTHVMRDGKYWEINFESNWPFTSYIDAVQVEDSAVSAYKENYIVENKNLGADSIDGNAMAFDSLLGSHLQAGELRINSDSQHGNRLVVGNEVDDQSFIKFTPSRVIYHQKDMESTSDGFKFTSHMESGLARFDTSIVFQHPYKTWEGLVESTAIVIPHIMISPYKIKTFDSAHSSEHQEIYVVTRPNPGGTGFYCNAFLQNTGAYQYSELGLFDIDLGSAHSHFIYSRNDIGYTPDFD